MNCALGFGHSVLRAIYIVFFFVIVESCASTVFKSLCMFSKQEQRRKEG